MLYSRNLEVLTNEKRGGLKVVAFNRSDFKAIHAEIFKQIGTSCGERPKTTKRNLFLSFEINNCFPITGILSEAYEKSLETWMPCDQFKHRYCLCRHSKNRLELLRYLKRFMTESRFSLSSQILGRTYSTIPLFQISL
jgi:hypothetical protein